MEKPGIKIEKNLITHDLAGSEHSVAIILNSVAFNTYLEELLSSRMNRMLIRLITVSEVFYFSCY